VSAAVLLAILGMAERPDVMAASTQPQAQPRAAAPALPPTQANEPFVSRVTADGTGRVFVTPDKADVTVGVEITAITLADAVKDANDRMTRVLEAIRAQGVASEDIQTSQYSVFPLTNFEREGEPARITGYRVSNVVTVRVRTIANAGKVLDAAVTAGANYVGGISFGVLDPSKAMTDARTLAVQQAAQKARTLADAAGVRLGRVMAITESVTPPPYIPIAREMAQDSSAGPIETGQLEISVTVQIQYELL
jgi:uncharacterized protein YggE